MTQTLLSEVPLKSFGRRCLLVVSFFLMLVAASKAQSPRTVTVKGTVADTSGVTIPGATVKVKSTGKAAVTNNNGDFTISVPSTNDVLVVSFIGYHTKEVPLRGRTSVRVTLVDQNAALNEVVVIGYGTVKKRDLTGAVSSVKGEDIAMNPVSNPIEALQGRVSGLDIQRTSGQAGASPSILLRGTRSITASGTPLYIVDGIEGSLSELNPDDIESIDVLKDASSTAIYGVKGANGVIIVTTKKAKAGKLQIDADSYYGVNGFASYPKPLTGNAWIQYMKDKYYANNGSYPTDLSTQLNLPAAAIKDIDSNKYVDWVKETLRTGVQQNHHISIRGGSEKVQGYFSLGLIDEKGIYKFDDLRVYNTRSGVDMQFGKIFKAGIQNTINWRDDNSTNSRVNKAFGVYPLGTPYNADGSVNLYPVGDGITVSPIANYEPGVYVNNSKNLSARLVPYLEIAPIHNLTIRSNFSVGLGYSRSGEFDNERSYNSASTSTILKEATYGTSFSYGYLWENIINYNFAINKDHLFTVTGITSLSDSRNETSSMTGQGLDYDSFLYYDIGAAATVPYKSTAYTGKALNSYAGRISYSYKGKYLLTITDRYDGASQLVRKWANFPSASAAWRISDENFMKNTKSWLSNLKLRGGYGITGNNDIAAYQSQTVVVSNSSGTPITLGGSSNPLPVYIPSKAISNPELTWEKTYNTNIGLDMGFFNERIELTADAYYSHTDGLLYALTLPSSSGGFDAKNPYTKTANIGYSVDRGLELTANFRVVSSKDFRWNSTLTYTVGREKLTALYLGNSVSPTQLISLDLFMNQPIHPWYDYKKIGIWQTSEATEAAKYGAKPGDIKIQTVPVVTNGVSDNGVHTYGPNDRMVIGHANPNWFGGWQNSFNYKGIDLNIFITARWGQTINPQLLGYYNSVDQPDTYNYWTPNNPTNDFPQPFLTSQNNSVNTKVASSLSYVDGSYWKIKNITLGYTLPAKLTKKIAISRLRFYGTAYNPFIYAKSHLLKDVDPETGGTDSFPLYKQLVFGMNVSF